MSTWQLRSCIRASVCRLSWPIRHTVDSSTTEQGMVSNRYKRGEVGENVKPLGFFRAVKVPKMWVFFILPASIMISFIKIKRNSEEWSYLGTGSSGSRTSAGCQPLKIHFIATDIFYENTFYCNRCVESFMENTFQVLSKENTVCRAVFHETANSSSFITFSWNSRFLFMN